MNITQLKETIIANPDYIEVILEAIPTFKIKDYGKEYRSAKYEDGSATGVCVVKDTLKYFYRGRDGETSGDIFTLVQDFKGVGFQDAIKFVFEATGLNQDDFNKSEEVKIAPFGGIYKDIKNYEDNLYQSLQTYPESVMDNFEKFISKRFIRDNIGANVQELFGIKYDLFSDRIAVPWRNAMGEIIGIMGRYNGDDYDELGIAKWFPIIKFPKSQAIFGFYENYKSIQEQKTIFIGESEKFVMQLRDMTWGYITNEDGEIIGTKNCQLGLAVGSHAISQVQKKMIQGCFPNTIIICFDEGIEESYLIETAKRLQYQSAFHSQIRIGYIYDAENKYLPKGSKASPSDFGKQVFYNLLTECTKFI